MPEGKTVHIEEIQDLVEKALMALGHFDIARRYIVYREARHRDRLSRKKPLELPLSWLKGIQYQTTSGELKPIDFNRLSFTNETWNAIIPENACLVEFLGLMPISSRNMSNILPTAGLSAFA